MSNIFAVLEVLSDPIGKGIPFILGRELGPDKGNALAPLLVAIVEDSKSHTVEEITAIVASWEKVEAGEPAVTA